MQLNLLQLVDSVSIQFKSTKENPESISLSSDHPAKLSKQKSEVLINSNNKNNNESIDESKFRNRNRKSFTDMPKI